MATNGHVECFEQRGRKERKDVICTQLYWEDRQRYASSDVGICAFGTKVVCT